MCAGFRAGTGNAHRFVNRSTKDVLLLVVGDRTAGDEVSYPDVDMHLHVAPDGKFFFTHKGKPVLNAVLISPWASLHPGASRRANRKPCEITPEAPRHGEEHQAYNLIFPLCGAVPPQWFLPAVKGTDVDGEVE